MDRNQSCRVSSLNNYRTDPLRPWYDKVRTRHSTKMLELLLPYLPSRGRVLEVGPGHGHFARAALEAGLDYDAIEPSDLFRESLVKEGFLVSNAVVPPIPHEDGIYDLVHASMLIENLPTSHEAAEFAWESARVLRQGGILSLIFPNYLTWGDFFFDEHYMHSFETTPRRVSHLLTRQGFNVVRTEHTLGWFWVKSSLTKNIIRHAANCMMWPLHTAAARWTFEYAGLGELHWKVRKTFFEAVVIIARKV